MKTASEIYTKAKEICDNVCSSPLNDDIHRIAEAIMAYEAARHDRTQKEEM